MVLLNNVRVAPTLWHRKTNKSYEPRC